MRLVIRRMCSALFTDCVFSARACDDSLASSLCADRELFANCASSMKLERYEQQGVRGKHGPPHVSRTTKNVEPSID